MFDLIFSKTLNIMRLKGKSVVLLCHRFENCESVTRFLLLKTTNKLRLSNLFTYQIVKIIGQFVYAIFYIHFIFITVLVI